jgi:hypothetical protein
MGIPKDKTVVTGTLNAAESSLINDIYKRIKK